MGPALTMKRPRLQHRESLLDETILSPGTVKINVQGAFIVDEVSNANGLDADTACQHDTNDIRLPNHKAVVSHVALDVSFLSRNQY